MANKVDLYDLCTALGTVAVLYGVSRWSLPAMWILLGLVLVAAGSAPLRKGKA